MDRTQVFALTSAAWAVALAWTQWLSYRHGIWDGAFNQFLPHVRKEMFRYDAERARRIFGQTEGE